MPIYFERIVRCETSILFSSIFGRTDISRLFSSRGAGSGRGGEARFTAAAFFCYGSCRKKLLGRYFHDISAI